MTVLEAENRSRPHCGITNTTKDGNVHEEEPGDGDDLSKLAAVMGEEEEEEKRESEEIVKS